MLVAVPDAGVCDTGHPVEPTALAVAPTADTDKPSGALAVPPGGNDAQQACRKAVAEKQKKAILAKCTEAFAADPRAADIAVLLAKLEFDRGRLEQAFDWSKKAIAVDPTLADAYVFIGEAEQSAGHAKAAKDAYARYLHLAPSGRYAADLRAVLRSL
jgi:tetratricopeptide (TPR) repeat protein